MQGTLNIDEYSPSTGQQVSRPANPLPRGSRSRWDADASCLSFRDGKGWELEHPCHRSSCTGSRLAPLTFDSLSQRIPEVLGEKSRPWRPLSSCEPRQAFDALAESRVSPVHALQHRKGMAGTCMNGIAWAAVLHQLRIKQPSS